MVFTVPIILLLHTFLLLQSQTVKSQTVTLIMLVLVHTLLVTGIIVQCHVIHLIVLSSRF